MMKDWALWFVLIGLSVDLLDAFTVKPGSTGGMFYDPTTGLLRTFNRTLPGAATPGVSLAMIGAAGLAYQKFA